MRGNGIAVIGLSMLFTLTAVTSFGYIGVTAVGVALLLIGVAILLYLYVIKQKRGLQLLALSVITLILCGISLLGFSFKERQKSNAVGNLYGTTSLIEGTVIDMPLSGDSYLYVIRVDAKQKYDLLLTSADDLGGRVYDRFKGCVTFSDLKNNAKHADIVATPYKDSASFYDGKGFGVRAMLSATRRYTSACVDRYLEGDTNALVKGILLGDASEMTIKTRASFNAVGLSHMIVISGLHMTIVVTLFLLFLPHGINRRWNLLLMLLPIIIYGALSGFGPSVIRAGVCSTLFIISKVMMYDSRPINNLGLTAIIVCLLWPQVATSVSFQLSYFATAGIVIIHPIVRNYLSKKRIRHGVKTILSVFMVTVSARLMVLPYSVMYFKTLTPFSIIANVTLMWVASAVIYFGMIMVLSSLAGFLMPLTYIAVFVCKSSADICILLVRLMSSMPFSSVFISRYLILMSICLIALIVAVITITRKRWVRKALTITICIVTVLTVSVSLINSLELTVVAVSKGCTVVTYQGQTIVLGDDDALSDSSTLSVALASRGIKRVDVLDLHKIEKSKVTSLVGLYEPEVVVVPKKSQPSSTDSILIFDNNGTHITLSSGLKLTVYDDYAVIKAGFMTLAIADDTADLTGKGQFDYILCRGRAMGDARVWIMHPVSKALAIDSKKVYNSKSDRFNFRLNRVFGLISE